MRYSHIQFVFSGEEMAGLVQDILRLYDHLEDDEMTAFRERYPHLNGFIDSLIATNFFNPNLKP